MKINLNEIIDPAEGHIVVRRDRDGKVLEAHFDLVGLPRVDEILTGKSALEALRATEHLCGICPVAHHLAGTRALDTLVGSPQVESGVEMVRRLLHYGSMVEAHSLRFLPVSREGGVKLKKFSKRMLAAAGSPGHFPVTAMPGGLAVWPQPDQLEALAAELPQMVQFTKNLVDEMLQNESTAGDDFTGANLALIDAQGRPDVFGTRVRATKENETIAEFDFTDWYKNVAEAVPGSPAPRPYLTAFGTEEGLYRVGPVAQLSIGALPTEFAAAAQTRWLAGAHAALSARAIIALHVLEATADLITRLGAELRDNPRRETVDESVLHLRQGTATGLVDGPRGILAHTSQVDASGNIARAIILTPTAQNEAWLSRLLTQAVRRGALPEELEESIRTADPCLPISGAPAGTMALKIDTMGNVTGEGE